MAEADEPGLPPPDGTDTGQPGRSRSRRGLVWALAALLLVLLGVGVGVLVAGGGSDSSTKQAAGSSTTTKQAAPSVVPVTTVATTASGGVPVTTKAGSGNATASTASTAPAPSTTTLPKPAFTSAAVSPGLVTCSSTGQYVALSLTWTTVNATGVSYTYGGSSSIVLPPNDTVTNPNGYQCGVQAPTSFQLSAHGPGGTTTVTVSFNYTNF